jgi:hypothetical protein
MDTPTYRSGVVLWIEDGLTQTLASGALRTRADAWRLAFGQLDNRIFRLMDLSLEIITNGQDALERIAHYRNPIRRHVLVQAVVDLTIPPTVGERPESKYGIDVAKHLQEARIPFYVTSAARDAAAHLDAEKIERTRYFSKVQSGQTSLLPEDLGRLLLQTFRQHITWIDLSQTIAAFDASSDHPLSSATRGHDMAVASRAMPYFAASRDFVERWELRSGRSNPHRIVLRSPADHSDEFVMQCVTVVISGIARGQPRVVYVTTRNQGPFRSGLGLGDIQLGSSFLVARFDGNRIEDDVLFLRSLQEKARHVRMIIVLPQDHRAERLLEALSSEPGVSYDDLPPTVLADSPEREHMIRCCARLLLQELLVDNGNGRRDQPLHPIYVRHPEVLINPIHWAMLLEAEHLAVDISDTFEVLDCLGRALEEIHNWTVEERRKLIDGMPLPIDRLIRPAESVLQRDTTMQDIWNRKAFHEWLTSSWQTPYSIRKIDPTAVDAATITQWENHCFDIALSLASRMQASAPRSAMRAAANHDHAIEDAAYFLCHPTIARMREGTVAPADWASLEAVRWPHQYFPMPSALHRSLREQGRYLWVQSDLLDRVGVVMSGREAMQRVEARAERHARRIDWLEQVTPKLPRGWREAAEEILQLISNRKIDEVWSDQVARANVWRSLYSLENNATPVSLLFYETLQAGTSISVKDISEKLNVHGPGKMLGVVRAKRAELATRAFRLTEPQHSSWDANLRHAAEHLEFLAEFANHPKHVKQLLALQKGADFVARSLRAEVLAPTAADSGAPNQQLQSLLRLLFHPDSHMAAEVLDTKVEMKTAHGVLGWDTMRGVGLDMMMILLDGAEKLRSAMLPLAYFDGYHLLSLLYEFRNYEKSVAPKVQDTRELHKLLEIFLLGFEGLVVQLQWCLQAAGRSDLAANIPNVALSGPEMPALRIENLDNFLRVRGGVGDYEVFTLGHSGDNCVDNLVYDDNGFQKVYWAVDAMSEPARDAAK